MPRPTVEEHIKALEKPGDERDRAISALKYQADIPTLKNALKSENPLVREGILKVISNNWSEKAVKTLGEHGEEAVSYIDRYLYAIDKLHITEAAIDALGKIGTKKAMEPLLKFLEHTIKQRTSAERDYYVGGTVGYYLERLGNQTLEVLKEKGRPETVAKLTELLKHENENVKKISVKMFSAIADKKDVPQIAELFEIVEGPEGQADNYEVRTEAAEALGRIPCKESVEELKKVLKNDDNDVVRRQAVRSLGKMKEHTPVQLIIDTLKKPDEGVWERGYAAEALGNLQRKGTLNTLLEEMKKENERIELEEQKEKPDKDKTGTFVLEDIVKAIGEFGDEGTIGDLEPFVRHKQQSVRLKAIEALLKIGGKKVMRPLIAAHENVDNEEERERIEAAIKMIEKGEVDKPDGY